jgi:hypothetical protein
MTPSFSPAKHVPRVPVLPNRARTSRAIQRASGAIREHASSALIAAAGAIATIAIIAAVTIVAAIIALEVDPIAGADALRAVLASNAAVPAARIVITAAIPDRHAVLSSFPRC